MSCCGNHSGHSQGNKEDVNENHNFNNVEKKNSWMPWIIVIFLILLLMFSVAR